MNSVTAVFAVFLLIGCAPALAQYDQYNQMRQQQQMRQQEDEARQQNEIRRMQEQQRQMEYQRQLDSQPRTGLWGERCLFGAGVRC
jgi:cytochrome c-type biogenesis protein CcmH/NrfG